MSVVVVRYKTKPDRAVENQGLVERVFAELDATEPAGLRYATLRLADGVSFVHIASVETDEGINPLTKTTAFAEFLKDVADRCDEPPAATDAAVVGVYRFFEDDSDRHMSAPHGTPDRPWILKTPSGGSEYTAYGDETLDPPALVVQVGKTELRYRLECLDDLHAMLVERSDWVALGSADEQKVAADGTVEAWARASDNPVGGWYGLKKGLRGRFANYVPPVMEQLGLAEVEHNARNNRMRATDA